MRLADSKLPTPDVADDETFHLLGIVRKGMTSWRVYFLLSTVAMISANSPFAP